MFVLRMEMGVVVKCVAACCSTYTKKNFIKASRELSESSRIEIKDNLSHSKPARVTQLSNQPSNEKRHFPYLFLLCTLLAFSLQFSAFVFNLDNFPSALLLLITNQ